MSSTIDEVVAAHRRVHPGGIRTNIVRATRGGEHATRARMVKWFERNAVPPERVAARIVSAIEHRRQRVVVTPEAWATDIFKRVYPPPPLRLASMVLRRSKLLK